MTLSERQARFCEILERNHARWAGIARAYAEPQDRDDLVQEIALQVWQNLDRFTGRSSWEDLVKREVFVPLKLTGVGFGPPKSPSETLDQPRGRRVVLGLKISANDDADNTPIMGPAGAIHIFSREP